MKLGAQFYTLRERNKTPEGLRESFRAMHEIGYEVAQMSAICPIEAERLRDFSAEFDLPITCTHSPFDRIIGDTDALIREHRIYGCEVIGLGAMPAEYRGSADGVRAFIKAIEEPIAKIGAAGLRFAYHNHAFEFDDLGGVCAYDMLIGQSPALNFILDTYWVHFAGADNESYIRLLGKADRLTNIHFKDMKSEPKGAICPCGEGVLDFARLAQVCRESDVQYALVEQDNAPDLGDEYEQMQTSYRHLKPLF